MNDRLTDSCKPCLATVAIDSAFAADFLRVFRLKGKFHAVSVSADASANLAVRLGRIKYLPRKAYLTHHVVWKILSQ